MPTRLFANRKRRVFPSELHLYDNNREKSMRREGGLVHRVAEERKTIM